MPGWNITRDGHQSHPITSLSMPRLFCALRHSGSHHATSAKPVHFPQEPSTGKTCSADVADVAELARSLALTGGDWSDDTPLHIHMSVISSCSYLCVQEMSKAASSQWLRAQQVSHSMPFPWGIPFRTYLGATLYVEVYIYVVSESTQTASLSSIHSSSLHSP